MTLPEELLKQLRCPETKQSLVQADEATLAKIRSKDNRAIDGALVREDGTRAYLIRNGFPVLLLDESVELTDP